MKLREQDQSLRFHAYPEPMSTLERNPHQPIVLAQFPLAKYSYAETTSDQHGPVNWTHLQANELNVVFEKEAMPVSNLSSLQKLRLRVVRAREQLVYTHSSYFSLPI